MGKNLVFGGEHEHLCIFIESESKVHTSNFVVEMLMMIKWCDYLVANFLMWYCFRYMLCCRQHLFIAWMLSAKPMLYLASPKYIFYCVFKLGRSCWVQVCTHDSKLMQVKFPFMSSFMLVAPGPMMPSKHWRNVIHGMGWCLSSKVIYVKVFRYVY